MNVTSTTQASYVYASNIVNKTSPTSQDTTTQTTQVDKMDEMKEKYKDVYTPIPETYSKADEDLQTQKVYEAYPNYISGPELFGLMNKIYTDELGGKPIIPGEIITSEQKEKEQIAWNQVNEIFGGEKALGKMIEGARAIKNDYPINNWEKNNITNSKELARFDNAVVYEALESGKTLEEAKKYAGSIRETFISMNNINGMPDAYKPDFNSALNTVWDLGKYGIEGDWTKNNIYNNDKAMISELEKKVNQFNFMLNNENLIKQADSNLNTSEQNLAQVNHYKEWINEKHLPEVQQALDIFKNYKIYDSIDVKA